MELLHAVEVLVSVQVAQVRAVTDEICRMGDPLVERFASLADDIRCLKQAASAGPDCDDRAGDRVAALVSDCAHRLQRFDAIEQRLVHVAVGLNQILGLIAEQDGSLTCSQWASAQAQLRAIYKMADERDVMDQVLGNPKDRSDSDGSSGDIDVFF